MARLRSRRHARNISTALDTTGLFPHLLQVREAAARFCRQGGMPSPCSKQSGCRILSQGRLRAHPWECILSSSTVPHSPVCSGEEMASTMGTPGSPTQPPCVPVPKDSCGTGGWWCCPGALLRAQGCCSQADRAIWGAAVHSWCFCWVLHHHSKTWRNWGRGWHEVRKVRIVFSTGLSSSCLGALTCHFCSLACLTCHGSLPAVGQP